MRQLKKEFEMWDFLVETLKHFGDEGVLLFVLELMRRSREGDKKADEDLKEVSSLLGEILAIRDEGKVEELLDWIESLDDETIHRLQTMPKKDLSNLVKRSPENRAAAVRIILSKKGPKPRGQEVVEKIRQFWDQYSDKLPKIEDDSKSLKWAKGVLDINNSGQSKSLLWAKNLLGEK
jgi:hypothetical protein